MDVEVVTPEDYIGDVVGDLNRRRGHIGLMEPRGNARVVRFRRSIIRNVWLCHRPTECNPRKG